MAAKVEDVDPLRAVGWNVCVAQLGTKAPIGSWQRYQTERVPERFLREQFERAPDGLLNLFVITGSVSRLAVLDCDNDAAIEYWRERIGPELYGSTTRVQDCER